jgi:alkanesulfonate monooxygenase SsuD/methylene tetrahydromethanopterin reductase-like flavin-dependent oxidoreductase (luciferase family)
MREVDKNMPLPWITHPWVTEGQNKIRFGVGVSARAPEPDWPMRLATVQAIEALGFDSFWVPDHPAFASDCWSILSALAVSTKRIRLGTLVCCVYYRSAAVLARLAADVDRLSGGRLILGLGAGWFELEFSLLGIPFPPVPERLRTLRTTIKAVNELLMGEPIDVDPKTMQTVGSALGCGPVQSPRIPLLVGGNGEQVTLRRVAEYADMCNILDGSSPQAPSPEAIRRKFDLLRGYCEAAGRPYDSIVRSHLLNPVVVAATRTRLEEKVNALPPIYQDGNRQGYGTPSEIIDYYRPLVEAGAQYLIVNLATHDDVETLELLAGQVIPELQGLTVSR